MINTLKKKKIRKTFTKKGIMQKQKPSDVNNLIVRNRCV